MPPRYHNRTRSTDAPQDAPPEEPQADAAEIPEAATAPAPSAENPFLAADDALPAEPFLAPIPEPPAPLATPEPPPAPSAHIMPPTPHPAPPTLEVAFFTLCQAMEPHLAENMPAYHRCREIQAWATNGGRDNAIQAWRHAVALLEQVVGVALVER